jgi:Zn-dependent protease with chaperone function
MTFQADYYDGLSARAKLVTVQVLATSMSFDVEGEVRSYNLAELDVQAKLGKAKRMIDLPDYGRLEALDLTELEAMMPSKAGKFWSVLHYLENHLGWVLSSVVMTVFAGWLFLQFGVPKLAEYVAKATPPSMEAKLGEQVLNGLDAKFGYFTPSNTEAARKASITASLKQLCVAMTDCPQYRLEFREGGAIGANAFALPGGIMVVTDEMVTLSKNDTEIVAVLAHELGHVKQRHAFRQSIQGVLSGLILAAVTGDVSSVGSGLPAVLMQMRYSREHEAEADVYALDAMQKACLPPKAFADILQRLQHQVFNDDDLPAVKDKSAKDKSAKAESNSKNKPKHENTDAIPEILSSHPDTQARIKPFLDAKPSCTPPAKI